MNETGKPAGDAPPRDERLSVLRRLEELLLLFGMANDIEDHWKKEEAVKTRAQARTGVRNLMQEHAFVTELLPALPARLDGTWIENSAWGIFYEEVRAEIRRLEALAAAPRENARTGAGTNEEMDR